MYAHFLQIYFKGQIIVYDSTTLKPIIHCRQQGNQQQVFY